jgi:hypothetical protein
MALTLPYPDMDFVPLDILTALELDQIVANIEYIANDAFPVTNANIADSAVSTTKLNTNAVSTAKIQDGAVTAEKIDFTTFKQPIYVAASTTTTLTTNFADIVTASNVPAGSYIVIARVACMGNGDSSAFDYIINVTNTSNTVISDALCCAKQKVANYDDSCVTVAKITLASATNVKIRVRRNTGTGTARSGTSGQYNATTLTLIPIY